MIVTASRDKSIILYHLTKDEKTYNGVPCRRLTGHSHFVQDVVLSSDGQFALSGSSDGELRLWYLNAGTTYSRFVGHTKEVLSVALSGDDRYIVSASRDRTIKLWNTLGECKYTIHNAHSDCVSCVRFSPNIREPTIVSASWDSTVKIWNLKNCKLRNTLVGHSGYVNTLAVSPNGLLCASGGNDGVILMWDLVEGKRLEYSFDTNGSIVHALSFCRSQYWLCAATDSIIKIWDLRSKSIVEEFKVEAEGESSIKTEAEATEKKVIYCTSLNWSEDGNTLFSGYTDGVVRKQS
ncbi:hypothetical protein TSUD_249540 [Trifolium subterraneum]|nr:hypothetical protein TSUD_249540 [Trifolium subterraneum]